MLEDIKGLGPKTIEALNNLGIKNQEDLLNYYPYRYNIYKPTTLSDTKEGETVVLTGTVESNPKVIFIRRNLNKLVFNFNDNNRIIKVVLFNRAFIKPNIIPGKKITVIGKYENKTNTLTASDIKLTPINKIEVEPVYHLNQKIKKQNFNKIIKNLLDKNIYIRSYIPEFLQKEYNLVSKQEAIKEIHIPTSDTKLKQARLHLIYEELFIFSLKMNYLKMNKKINNNYIIKNFDTKKINDFINNLPFTLTTGQVNAIEDIKKDFNSEKRMNRLILGDVGSGKTIVAFIALYMNYLSGYQGVLMSPTEILAKQHYLNIVKLFPTLRIKLLTSSTLKKERQIIIADAKQNNIDIIISTHSVLNEEIKFNNLGLVITDEQHRFGVNQRKNLQIKGNATDVLYMSATPIPRTLALSLYGEMDITEIKTKPANRKPIITKLYQNKDIKIVLTEMLEEIKKGHQIYVVCPLIEDEEEEQNLTTVVNLKEKLNEAFNNKIPTEILHGKMKPAEKEQIMKSFKNNNIKILISTTIIEIGVDVSNATMMVIFNAERFGLATLHQLRGRIGRNDLDCKCIIISDYESPRLKVLEESNDGFYISQKDFELRGSGDLFGIKQSGDMNFKLANINSDYKILKKCIEDSEEVLKNIMENNEYPELKLIINSLNNLN